MTLTRKRSHAQKRDDRTEDDCDIFHPPSDDRLAELWESRAGALTQAAVGNSDRLDAKRASGTNMRPTSSAGEVLTRQLPVPRGVEVLPLQAHFDDRGRFTEIYRDEWRLGPRPVQWSMVRSAANVLRGVHVHALHVDYLTMAHGELVLGLRDLRPSSPSHGLSVLLTLSAEDPHLVVIPVGVAHGFYFPKPACHIYSVTTAFDGSDEFGCRWDDPGLELSWPCSAPLLSERDRAAGPLSKLLAIPSLRERA